MKKTVTTKIIKVFNIIQYDKILSIKVSVFFFYLILFLLKLFFNNYYYIVIK